MTKGKKQIGALHQQNMPTLYQLSRVLENISVRVSLEQINLAIGAHSCSERYICPPLLNVCKDDLNFSSPSFTLAVCHLTLSR